MCLNQQDVEVKRDGSQEGSQEEEEGASVMTKGMGGQECLMLAKDGNQDTA